MFERNNFPKNLDFLPLEEREALRACGRLVEGDFGGEEPIRVFESSTNSWETREVTRFVALENGVPVTIFSL